MSYCDRRLYFLITFYYLNLKWLLLTKIIVLERYYHLNIHSQPRVFKQELKALFLAGSL